MKHPDDNMKGNLTCRDCVHGISVSIHSEKVVCIVELEYKSGGHAAVCEHALPKGNAKGNVLPVRLEDETKPG